MHSDVGFMHVYMTCSHWKSERPGTENSFPDGQQVKLGFPKQTSSTVDPGQKWKNKQTKKKCGKWSVKNDLSWTRVTVRTCAVRG